MKTMHVVRREYLEAIRRKAFMITTFVLPIVMSMFFVVPGRTDLAIAAAAKCGATVLPTRWAVEGVRVDKALPISTPEG